MGWRLVYISDYDRTVNHKYEEFHAVLYFESQRDETRSCGLITIILYPRKRFSKIVCNDKRRLQDYMRERAICTRDHTLSGFVTY